MHDYICGATSLNLYYFDFSEPFFLEWVPLSPLRPPWSEKFHMDQGSGHIPIDRGDLRNPKMYTFIFTIISDYDLQ